MAKSPKYWFIKTLHQWPLSKVDLVEVEERMMILKTIHSDFVDEVHRQKYLSKLQFRFRVPPVVLVDINLSNVQFLQKYIPGSQRPSRREAYDLVCLFHKETRTSDSRFFPEYGWDEFRRDFIRVGPLLPKKSLLNQFNPKEIMKFFESVFVSSYSIIHGDWDVDQMVGDSRRGWYIIDFGKSRYGPSILDVAHLFLKLERIPKYVQDEYGLENLWKAKIICHIIVLRWYQFCQEKKYFDYAFTKEKKRHLMGMREALKKLEG